MYSHTLVFQNPPEVRCFRYVFGGPNTSSPGAWKPRDILLLPWFPEYMLEIPQSLTKNHKKSQTQRLTDFLRVPSVDWMGSWLCNEIPPFEKVELTRSPSNCFFKEFQNPSSEYKKWIIVYIVLFHIWLKAPGVAEVGCIWTLVWFYVWILICHDERVKTILNKHSEQQPFFMDKLLPMTDPWDWYIYNTYMDGWFLWNECR